tara:strand:- start:456 stop:953 length:498 start_codon:yes stop_codon:yes gene_type:complete
MNKENNVWTKSPITEKNMVLQELDDKAGVSKMDLSSGYYTNEYPLNYKKHPDFNLSDYERPMPILIKDLKFDDGESYWYPTTIQTENEMLFPVGTVIATAEDGETHGGSIIKWCYAKVKKLTDSEKDSYSKDIDFESKLDMENAEYFVDFLQAAKKIKGFSLGDI